MGGTVWVDLFNLMSRSESNDRVKAKAMHKSETESGPPTKPPFLLTEMS